MESHSFHFGKPKTDLTLVWRGVFFAPSAEFIRTQLKDKAKIEQEKRFQQEQTLKMYELFGSGKMTKQQSIKSKSIQKLMHKLSDKDSDEMEVVVEKENFPGSMKTSVSTKLNSRKIDSMKHDPTSKRRASLTSISPDVDIRFRPSKVSVPLNNLNIIFRQNRPAQFLGIRKPKNFESADERENRDTVRRSSAQHDIVVSLMNKQKSESESKDSSKRGSVLKRLSMQLTTVGVDELRDRFLEINKSMTGGSSKAYEGQQDVLEVLTKLTKDSIIDKYHLLSLSGYQKLEIPDMIDMLPRTRIMELYVNKYYRIRHPLRMENARFVHETQFEERIMKNCVLNNALIVRLMNKRSFYPYRLQSKMAEIDVSLNASQEDSTSKASDLPVVKRTAKKSKSSLKGTDKIENILDEICVEVKEFNSFYRPLLDYCFENIFEFKDLIRETDAEKIKKYVQSLSYTLSIHRNHPGSMARTLTQQFIKAGEYNPIVLNELVNNVEGWLDQILKTFLSKFQSVRLEAFVTLSYLFSKKIYVNAIYSHIFNETVYDVLSSILRCSDLKSEDFDMHYCMIGILFHYAPSQILLDCLLDRAPYSYHIDVVSKWPRFLYYAFKYWNSSDFNSSVIHLKRMIETLENHYLRESLSRKYLKEAITCITKRFNVTSTMFTTWSRHNCYFPE